MVHLIRRETPINLPSGVMNVHILRNSDVDAIWHLDRFYGWLRSRVQIGQGRRIYPRQDRSTQGGKINEFS